MNENNQQIELDLKVRQAIRDGNDVGEIIILLGEHSPRIVSYSVIEYALVKGKFEIFKKLMDFTENNTTEGNFQQYLVNLLTKVLELGDVASFEELSLHYDIRNVLRNQFPVTNLENQPGVDETDSRKVDRGKRFREAESQLRVREIENNPLYILLMEQHPIRKSIESSHKLMELASELPEHKKQFRKLAESCKRLPVDLLDCCKSWEEIDCLLSNTSADRRFLEDVVENELIEFITHPYCQFWLHDEWLGNMKDEWPQKSLANKVFEFVFRATFYPFFSLYSVINERRVLSPFKCYIYSVGSYMSFLLILMLSVFHDKIRPSSTEPFSTPDYAASVWIISSLIQCVRNFFSQPYKNYNKAWWTLYEFITYSLFLITAFCYMVANILAKSDRLLSSKWLLGAEGIYAIAITFAFMRILRWTHLSSSLGPVVVSFSRMTSVVLQLLLIFAIVLVSFSFGLYRLYRDFHIKDSSILPGDQTLGESDDDKDEAHFSTYVKTVKVLFWIIFGYGEADNVVIPSSYYWNKNEEEEIILVKQSYTMVIGYFMWAIFHVAFLIVMLNMLIAIMTTTYENIQADTDGKWKLIRTKLWFYYMKKHNALPPPFNVLSYIIEIAELIFGKENKGNYEVKEANEEQYQDVLRKLTDRYQWSKCSKNKSERSKTVVSYANIRNKLRIREITNVNSQNGVYNCDGGRYTQVDLNISTSSTDL